MILKLNELKPHVKNTINKMKRTGNTYYKGKYFAVNIVNEPKRDNQRKYSI